MVMSVMRVGFLAVLMSSCNLFSARERSPEPPKTTPEKDKETPPSGQITAERPRPSTTPGTGTGTGGSVPSGSGEQPGGDVDSGAGAGTSAPSTGREMRVSLLPSRTGKKPSLFQNCLQVGLGQDAPKTLCNNDASLVGKPVVWSLPAGDATNYVWFQVRVAKPTPDTMQNCLKGASPCNYDAGTTMLPSPKETVITSGEKSVPSRFCVEDAPDPADGTKRSQVFFEDNTDFDYDDLNFAIDIVGGSKVTLTSYLTYQIIPTATGGCPKAPGKQRDLVVKALTPDSH